MKIIKASEIRDEFFEYSEIGDMEIVKKILEDVRISGDKAVKEYTKKFDNVDLSSFKVEKDEIESAYNQLTEETLTAIKDSAENIRKFADRQMSQFNEFEMEVSLGVFAGQKVVPVERACVYAPGGNFPLPSSVLMGVIPAKSAGVEEVIVCSPPTFGGTLHPAVIVAADIAGADEIYKIGGVQAIGAAAYGTDSIAPVSVIVGPGNKYVTAAKKAVFGAVGIDLIAGPSEVLIFADDSANSEFIAADLLAQAEHDKDAISILVTTSETVAEKVSIEVEKQLENLDTKETAKVSIENNGVIIIVEDIEQAVDIINRKAPEHLEIQIEDPDTVISKLKNYGGLFIGENSVEALGDYCAGPNHTLPTSGAARYTAGLSVKDFIKLQTTLRVEKEGLKSIGKTAITMAEAEGLSGHAESIRKRVNY